MANVSVNNLSKRFGGKTPTTAIDDLDLEIEEGEFLVLLGPSGCGKTTTLRCLAGLETADAGSIAFGDRTVFDAAKGVNVPPRAATRPSPPAASPDTCAPAPPPPAPA